MIVRAATAADLPFLRAMAYEAATWRPEAQPPPETILGDPAVARYVSGWGRFGDAGVIGEEDGPVGAAWYRLFPTDNPALQLYERTGFVRVADDGGAWTMLLELRPS